MVFDDFKQAMWELLHSDDEACAALLAPWGLDATVSLVEGDVSVIEALGYARVLAEMGLDDQAHEIFECVVASVLRAPRQAA
jgi:hypothetical protein